jgi:Mrp family chromosome partitioning ATPase
MSHADSFKSRIIEVARTAPASASQSNGHAGRSRSDYGSGSTTMPLQVMFEPQPPQLEAPQPVPFEAPAPREEVITTLALSTPVLIMEEVQPESLGDPRLIVLQRPASEQARSFRLLQHRLFAQHDPRVIAVTSALPGEGKTTCAANLALVLSEQTFSNVLLVDGNLTRPGIGDLFRFEPAESLMAKLLRSEDASVPYAVASLAGSRLQLAALRPDAALGKRLDRPLLSSLLRALRGVYDYIVVDTAAVSESADAHVVGQCADAVLVSARAGRSRKTALRRTLAQLDPANVAGVVLLDT